MGTKLEKIINASQKDFKYSRFKVQIEEKPMDSPTCRSCGKRGLTLKRFNSGAKGARLAEPSGRRHKCTKADMKAWRADQPKPAKKILAPATSKPKTILRKFSTVENF